MRRLVLTLLVLAAAGLARAADEPKPNTLTPKEIADGWILLFDGETTFGWTVEGPAEVKDGVLVLGGERAAKLTAHFPFPSYRLELQVRPGPDTKNAWGTWFSEVEPGGFSEGGSPVGGEIVARPGKGAGGRMVLSAKAGAKYYLRTVKLLPRGLKPLFNGKDLTGWKKYTADGKRDKTEFSVTSEGYLHLKNGPGDLQSEKQFADFVLQATCRTNGKNLNSGVFFRCIPGDYQNGYEAQIHNGFADAPKEYVVDQYDPKTHELLKDKLKVKSAAIDYGTGAVYRRVPARTHAAKDGEWFTMTVAAHGRHIATWVNGVQQVDWTDNRPENVNPRNGCRLEKGPVSLQGHDATTDIDFRDIRAVALPAPAGD